MARKSSDSGNGLALLMLVGIATLSLLTGGAAWATGRSVINYPTHVRLDKAVQTSAGNGRYKGRIVRSKPLCKKRREVQIFDETPSPDVRLARTRSPKSGKWTAIGQAPPSGHDVYAIVEAKVVNKNGNTYTCKAARSKTLIFPTP